MSKETKNEIIKKMIVENGIIIEDFIDFIIKENGIVGVGLITLSEHLADYIKKDIR